MFYLHPYSKRVPKTYLVENLKPSTNKLIISRKNFELFQDFFSRRQEGSLLQQKNVEQY